MEVNIITEETQSESTSDEWEDEGREKNPLPRLRITRKGRTRLTLKNRTKPKRKRNNENSREDKSITVENVDKKRLKTNIGRLRNKLTGQFTAKKITHNPDTPQREEAPADN